MHPRAQYVPFWCVTRTENRPARRVDGRRFHFHSDIERVCSASRRHAGAPLVQNLESCIHVIPADAVLLDNRRGSRALTLSCDERCACAEGISGGAKQ